MIDVQDYSVIDLNEIIDGAHKIAEQQLLNAIETGQTQKIEELLPPVMRGKFDDIDNLGKMIEDAIRKAKVVREKATNAKNKSAGLFQKKEAIEALQEATSDIADAQVTVVDAQTLTFNYLNKMGEITKYLFNLGITNIALNRRVVRELEKRLQGASEEEISDFAKQELMGVIEQLNAQVDIMEKQEKTLSIVKDHDTILSKLRNDSHEKGILISQQTQKLESQEKLIAIQIEKSNFQAELLKVLNENEKQQNELLTKENDKNNTQDTLIEVLVQKNVHQEEQICILLNDIESLKLQLESKPNPNALIIAVVVSAISLVLTILHFFI